MSHLPSIFQQKDPASLTPVKVSEIAEVIPKGSWVVVQNAANFNQNCLPTPFFSRYQARQVTSLYEAQTSQGKAFLGLSTEGQYALYPEHAPVANIIFVGSQEHAVNLAVALSEADCQVKHLMQALLSTGGDSEKRNGFIKPFLKNLDIKDSYTMVNND